jgi:very-short-patch-repair endonuclease
MSDFLATFLPQNIANTAWAFAKTGNLSLKLFDAISRELRARSEEFKPQELANIAWAFASSGVKNRESYTSLVRAFLDKIPHSNNLNLVTMVWSLATAEYSHPELFKHVAQELVRSTPSGIRMNSFSSQNIANALWAFAKARVLDREFLAHSKTVVMRLAPRMNAQEISNSVWALATFSVEDQELFSTLGNEYLSRSGEFTGQGFCNVAWGLATQDDNPLARPVLATSLLRANESGWALKNEEQRALLQTCLALQHEVPESLLEVLAMRPPKTSGQSNFETEVEGFLLAHNIQFRKQVAIAGYLVDFLITTDTQRIALDCNPFTFNGTNVRPGSEKIRAKVLSILGLSLISATATDWKPILEALPR